MTIHPESSDKRASGVFDRGCGVQARRSSLRACLPDLPQRRRAGPDGSARRHHVPAGRPHHDPAPDLSRDDRLGRSAAESPGHHGSGRARSGLDGLFVSARQRARAHCRGGSGEARCACGGRVGRRGTQLPGFPGIQGRQGRGHLARDGAGVLSLFHPGRSRCLCRVGRVCGADAVRFRGLDGRGGVDARDLRTAGSRPRLGAVPGAISPDVFLGDDGPVDRVPPPGKHPTPWPGQREPNQKTPLTERSFLKVCGHEVPSTPIAGFRTRTRRRAAWL